MRLLFILTFLWTGFVAHAGVIQGNVYDEINNEAIIGANVVVQGTTIGTSTDIDGNFIIENLAPGLYNLVISYLGYETKTIFELQVTNSFPVVLKIPMRESSAQLETVEVVANPFKRPSESPLSLNSIGVNEIQRSPGGNRDISRVVKLLPGVSTGTSFRNDILVRGGSPSENRFYLDDIEVPTINHFTTQGASGGSNGLINVDFIRNVDFYSGAFPANRGNSLSSVLEFNFKEARTDRIGFTATVGASDLGITVEGPLDKAKKNTFMLSARRSYLQLLFKAIGLPFLPTYNDFQFKTTHKIGKRGDLSFIGLGAIDDFELNLERADDEVSRYQIGYLPYFKQWNYTIGSRYRYFTENGTLLVVASRNMLSNQIFKYQGNQNDVPEAKLFDLTSREAENKVRVEYTFRKAGYKFNFGTNYEFARYTNKTFRRLESEIPIPPFEYDALLKMQKYGFFAQVSKRYFDDKLSVSAGLRADANNYSKLMNNPLKQLSPRLSLSYNINDSWSVSANTGLYYQLPVYTLLGYKNQAGEFQNKNTLKYIKSAHYVAGVAYTTTFNTKFSVEGFYKKYSNYPLLTQKGISFANEGGDYGVVGDEPADATSKGKAYGVEFLAQQKLYKGLFGIVSYTYYRSIFTDATGKYAPASWDNQHILNIALGYKFKKNWELGTRWVISGGQPYTPFDIDFSSNKNVWDVRGRGVPDYQNVNSERLKPYTQLDVRVDKKWFFKKWNLNLYLDLTNVYMAAQDLPDDLVLVTDNNGVPLTNPDDESKYQTKLLNSDSGNLLPTIGVVVGF